MIEEWKELKLEQIHEYHETKKRSKLWGKRFPIENLKAKMRHENIASCKSLLPNEAEVCPVCEGSGRKEGTFPRFCYVCEGEGALQRSSLPLCEKKPFLNDNLGIPLYDRED